MTRLSCGRIIRFLAHPLPPLLSASCLSFSVFLCVAGRACWRERGWARSQIIRPRESLNSTHYSILFGFISCISCTLHSCCRKNFRWGTSLNTVALAFSQLIYEKHAKSRQIFWIPRVNALSWVSRCSAPSKARHCFPWNWSLSMGTAVHTNYRSTCVRLQRLLVSPYCSPAFYEKAKQGFVACWSVYCFFVIFLVFKARTSKKEVQTRHDGYLV
jgi:hypothetical protein